MSLEVLNNRADHTHDNEQFRRIVDIIEHTFEKNGYSGILIGNPFNEHFYRFRADAILLYDNGLIIVDFKDYEGVIQTPENEDDFERGRWYSENIKDKVRTEVKGGSYSNPFYQLKKYRESFYEVVETIPQLNINPSRVSIINIFSGPITIENKIPRKFRYYRLLQESNLGDFLEDFTSENSYSENLGMVLKTIFPADEWIKSHPLETEDEPLKVIEIETDVENSIREFLKEDNGGVLVLESMNSNDRDSWMRYL